MVVFGATKCGLLCSGTQGERHEMTVHDMEKAQATYSGFMGMLKWAVPAIALIVLVVVALIAN
jgi:hypothetical protein